MQADTAAIKAHDDGRNILESAEEQPEKCETYAVEANLIKKGCLVAMNGHPYTVVNISYSKTGKHGIAKVMFTGISPFTGKKHEQVSPQKVTVACPYFRQEEHLVIETDAGHRRLYLEDSWSAGRSKLDILAAEEGEEDLFKAVESLVLAGEQVLVTVLECMGQKKAIYYRSA